LLVEQPSIVAGDLNNHVRWDKPGKASNHANAVIASAALGLVSAYHAFHELAQGAERHPTLYWRDRKRCERPPVPEPQFPRCEISSSLPRLLGRHEKFRIWTLL
jgi:hypothetical protein